MSALEGDAAELIDRATALREIDALVAEAHALGNPALVRVSGRPGIGKTALLNTAAHRIGSRILYARAKPAMRMNPGALVRFLVGPGDTDGNGSSGLVAALLACFAEHDVIVLDDLQWLDEISARIIRSAIDGFNARVTVLFGDRREDAPDLPRHHTIPLSPLRRTDAIELAQRHFPAARLTVLGAVADASGGLPFAIVVLAGEAARHNAGTAQGVALSVFDVIAHRLVRSAEPARNAARLISLLDPPVDLGLIARAANVSAAAVSDGLLDLDDLVDLDGAHAAFRHDSIRLAVASTVRNKVASYARLLGALGADDDHVSRLATIVMCAQGCGDWPRAATASLRLARTLSAAGSLGGALHYIEMALECLPGRPATAYAIEYAGILQQLSRDEEAARFLQGALRHAIESDDAFAAGDLLVSYAAAAIALERFAELDGFCDSAATLRANGPEAVGRIRTARLMGLAYSGQLEEYFRLAQAELMSWGDRRTEAFAHALTGDVAGAHRALSLYTVGLRSEHGRQQPVDRILEATVTFWNQGPGALGLFDALPIEDTRHASEWALRALMRIADGRWDEARSVLRASVSSYDEAPHQLLEVRTLLAALASDSVLLGNSLLALRKMISGRRPRHAIVPARWYLIAAADAAPADVESFVRETLAIAPMPYQFTAIPLALALMESRLGAVVCTDALKAFPSYGSRWHRSHYDLAIGLLDADYERLRSARDAFDAMKAPAFAAIAGIALPLPRARDLNLAGRLRIGHIALPQPAALTPRQRDIAELVARGFSNREIAAALTISERTVETHLTTIFTKLGITSRTALAAHVLSSAR